MPRTVPSLSLQNPSNIVSSALWNSGPKAVGDFYTAPPMFRGHASSAQTFTSGVWAAVALNVTDVDTDSGHSNVTNNSRYTAQVTGLYWVNGFCAWTSTANAAAPIYCALYINGSIMLGTGQALQKTANTFSAVAASGLVYLHVNDYVEVWARQDTGANMNTAPNTDLDPCMNLVWVHA